MLFNDTVSKDMSTGTLRLFISYLTTLCHTTKIDWRRPPPLTSLGTGTSRAQTVAELILR